MALEQGEVANVRFPAEVEEIPEERNRANREIGRRLITIRT